MPSHSLSTLLLVFSLYCVLGSAHTHPRIAEDKHSSAQDHIGATLGSNSDPLPPSTREHWMRRARVALVELTGSPCPFQPFGTAIVNHTGRPDSDLGDLICIGEVAAINNCTAVLSSPPYNLSPAEITAAWRDLSLYTTAEACTMCASAINWAGFREYVYSTDITTLLRYNWFQISMSSRDLLSLSPRKDEIRVVGGVLADEMDQLYRWQFQPDGKCPDGCAENTDLEDDERCVVK